MRNPDLSNGAVVTGWTALLYAAAGLSDKVIDYITALPACDEEARLKDALLLLGAELIDQNNDYTSALQY